MLLLLATLLLPAFASAPPDDDEVAARLTGRALLSDQAWRDLVVLSDDIGHRLAGSEALDEAIAWAVEVLQRDGLAAVRTEPVMVPKWVRGDEALRVLAPRARDVPLLALGSSVGTGPEGLEGEVIAVDDFDHLEALGDAVEGRIVLFDVPFTTYGEVSKYRLYGPSRAAAQGAAGVLLRSIAPAGGRLPHTGTLIYAEGVPKIPAAAIPVEDALHMRRDLDQGRKVRVRLTLGARMEGEVESANVLGEVRGREHPDEVVVLACHLDSWDVGQGAQDDGAGCVIAMQAARLIGELETPPRRTVRVVLYTNEENGLRGGRAYAARHADETHVAAIESDTGAGAPAGFRVDVRRDDEGVEARVRDALLEHLSPAAPLLEGVGATRFEAGYGGVDIMPLAQQGVLALGVQQDTSGYWPIHHTVADTIDKVDRHGLRKNVAAVAVLGWWLSEHGVPVVE